MTNEQKYNKVLKLQAKIRKLEEQILILNNDRYATNEEILDWMDRSFDAIRRSHCL